MLRYVIYICVYIKGRGNDVGTRIKTVNRKHFVCVIKKH